MTAPVAFIGAVSQNAGVTRALREAFGLAEAQLIVPERYAWCGAIGAAMLEARGTAQALLPRHPPAGQHEAEASVRRTPSRFRWRTWCCSATGGAVHAAT